MQLMLNNSEQIDSPDQSVSLSFYQNSAGGKMDLFVNMGWG
jgi:hypothetical protein